MVKIKNNIIWWLLIVIIFLATIGTSLFFILKKQDDDGNNFSNNVLNVLKDTEIEMEGLVGFGLANIENNGNTVQKCTQTFSNNAITFENEEEQSTWLPSILIGINEMLQSQRIVFKKIQTDKKIEQQTDIDGSITRFNIMNNGFTIFQYTSNEHVKEEFVNSGRNFGMTEQVFFQNNKHAQTFLLDNFTGKIYSITETITKNIQISNEAYIDINVYLNGVGNSFFDIYIVSNNNYIEQEYSKYLYTIYIDENGNLVLNKILHYKDNYYDQGRLHLDAFGNAVFEDYHFNDVDWIADDVLVFDYNNIYGIGNKDYDICYNEINKTYYRVLRSSWDEISKTYSTVEYFGNNRIWITAENSEYLIYFFGATYVLRDGIAQKIYSEMAYVFENMVLTDKYSKSGFDDSGIYYICDIENANNYYKSEEFVLNLEPDESYEFHWTRMTSIGLIAYVTSLENGIHVGREYLITFEDGEFSKQLANEVFKDNGSITIVKYFDYKYFD